jgi:hypothetical protein
MTPEAEGSYAECSDVLLSAAGVVVREATDQSITLLKAWSNVALNSACERPNLLQRRAALGTEIRTLKTQGVDRRTTLRAKSGETINQKHDHNHRNNKKQWEFALH